MVGRPRKKEISLSENSTIKKYFEVRSLLEEKPYTIKEISEKTGIKEKAVYGIKDNLLFLNEIKKVRNKFVVVDYSPIEEDIEDWLKIFYKKRNQKFPTKMFPERLFSIAAMDLQEEDNDEFKKSFRKVCKKHSIKVVPDYV